MQNSSTTASITCVHNKFIYSYLCKTQARLRVLHVYIINDFEAVSKQI